MIAITDPALDLVFGALSDPTRRQILRRLSKGPVPVTELAEPFDMSLPAVSKHIRVLEKAGMVRRHREGRVHRLELEAQPMKTAVDWIAEYRQFWESSLDSLERYLEETDPAKKKPKK